jgi:LPS sulfotransferase NodH
MKKTSSSTTKFMIFGQGRTGSELLCNLLDSHPNIKCDTEILFHHVFFPQQYIESKAALTSNKAYGFKGKIYQIQEIQKQDANKFLSEIVKRGWKLIYLQRRNLLRHSLSRLVAKQRNKFHHKSNEKLNLQKVPIDTNLLLQEMETRKKYLEREKKMLENIDCLQIVYENDLLYQENHQDTADRIFNFLGFESVSVKTNFQKLTPQRLSDFIENFEEVERAVARSKYSQFIKG